MIVNVTDIDTTYTKDVMKHPEGDSWNQACPKFNLTGSSQFYDPEETSVCTFELCPQEYYKAVIRNCEKDVQVDLFSYSDVQYTNYNLACEDDYDNGKVAILYFDTIGVESCRLFSFYSFCDSVDDSEWCSGQLVLTKRSYPSVGISWSDDSKSARGGDNLKFVLSDMTIDYDYWDYGEVSFWVVIYKEDMLTNQEYCGYRDYSSTDFYDYIGKDYILLVVFHVALSNVFFFLLVVKVILNGIPLVESTRWSLESMGVIMLSVIMVETILLLFMRGEMLTIQ